MNLFSIVQEEIKKFLKEWDNPKADWIYDLYEERDQIMHDTIVDFMQKPFGAHQPWKLVPFNLLKRIWQDAATFGYVRDTKGLQEIQDRMIRNLLKLDVNTELLGHMQGYPDDNVFEDAGTTKEEFMEKINNSHDVYWSSLSGGDRISDYALRPLWKYAEKLISEKDPVKKIQYIDQMLNVVHMRTDLAGEFVEGGSQALSNLSNEERKWEVHRPL